MEVIYIYIYNETGLSREPAQQEREAAGSGGGGEWEAVIASDEWRKMKQQRRAGPRRKGDRHHHHHHGKRTMNCNDEGEGEEEEEQVEEEEERISGCGGERQREHPFIVTEPGEVARGKKNGLDYLFHLYEQCREFLLQVQNLTKDRGEKCPTKVPYIPSSQQ